MVDTTTNKPKGFFSRLRPRGVLSVVAVGATGAVAASAGIAMPAAFADQNYPSWDDVQKAKQNEASTKAEIDRIGSLLTGLQLAAEEASVRSQKAAEAYRVSLDDLDAAKAREASLTRQAAAAKKKAETSKMRAGLIAAHLAKTGGQDLSVNLFLNGNGATDLLHQLGTASKLSEQSEMIYREALQDQNTAEALGEQAASAKAERERLTKQSKDRYSEASAAAQEAEAAYTTQQEKSDQLFEQLAVLKNTTAETERSYRAGVEAAAAAKALAEAQAAAAAKAKADADARAAKEAADKAAAEAAKPKPTQPRPAQPVPQPPATGGSSGGGSSSSGSGSSGGSGSSSGSSGGSGSSSGSGSDSGSSGSGSSGSGSVGAPNASAVQTAIAFAQAQLGERYELGGSGPDVWDCSGLTKAAYAAAGIYIGTHSATNQYYTMADRGLLVPFSDVRVGDLVFWSSGYDYYHVAIYVGGGQVLEAPDVGKPVRIHSIWGWSDVASYVGRPSA